MSPPTMAKRKPAHKLSTQQKRALQEFKTGTRPVTFRARAGTGKTYIICLGVEYMPEERIVICAFNVRIKDELNKRITNPAVKVQTLHSLGLGIVRAYWPNVAVGEGKARANYLTLKVCGLKTPDQVKRLVTRLHSYAREAMPLATGPGDLIDAAMDQECEPDPHWAHQGYDTEYVCEKAYAAMEAATVGPVAEIDYSDMIFLPVRNKWLNPMFDAVIVDEAQDMSMAQLLICEGVCSGRLILVGDDRQAIYGFRGADSGSLDRLKKKLDAVELGLTTTYRCGKVIVEEAKKIVPDFEAGPYNPEGEIQTIVFDKLVDTVTPGDFVLSRTNAPLADVAMALVRKGVPVRIIGRDIGTGLKGLVNKLSRWGDVQDINQLIQAVQEWSIRECERMIAADKEGRVPGIRDRAETILTLAADADSANAVLARIEELFAEDLKPHQMVSCSSVHRAKGLEADRVFVLQDTLRTGGFGHKSKAMDPADMPDEEENIKYVAITRAKNTLVWVVGGVAQARPVTQRPRL